MVPGERIELPTNGLQNRCSTAELTRHILNLFSYLRGLVSAAKPPFATNLLPLGIALLSAFEIRASTRVAASPCIPGMTWVESVMPILTVSKPFAGDLGMYAGREHVGSVRADGESTAGGHRSATASEMQADIARN